MSSRFSEGLRSLSNRLSLRKSKKPDVDSEVNPSSSGGSPWIGELLTPGEWLLFLTLIPICGGYVLFTYFSRTARINYKEILDAFEASSNLVRVLITGYLYWVISLGVFIALLISLVLLSLGATCLHRCRSKGQPKGKARPGDVAVPTSRQRRAFGVPLFLLLAIESLAILAALATLCVWIWLYASALVLKTSTQSALSAQDVLEAGPAAAGQATQTDLNTVRAVLAKGKGQAPEVTVPTSSLVALLNSAQQVELDTLIAGDAAGNGTSPICPKRCVDLNPWGNLIVLEATDYCDCSLDASGLNELLGTVDSLRTELIWSGIGSLLMVLAWVVALMRLAALWQSFRLRAVVGAPLSQFSNPEFRDVEAAPGLTTPGEPSPDRSPVRGRSLIGNESFVSAKSFMTTRSFGSFGTSPSTGPSPAPGRSPSPTKGLSGKLDAAA